MSPVVTQLYFSFLVIDWLDWQYAVAANPLSVSVHCSVSRTLNGGVQMALFLFLSVK